MLWATNCQFIATLHLIIYMGVAMGNNNAKIQKKPSLMARASFSSVASAYLASFFSKNFLYLLLNLSTRPAVSTSFILPV